MSLEFRKSMRVITFMLIFLNETSQQDHLLKDPRFGTRVLSGVFTEGVL